MGEDGTCWGQGEARARPQSNEGMVGLLNVPRFPLFWITGGYCWPTSFNVLGVLFLGAVSSAFLPSKKASWTPKFRNLGVDQQYPPGYCWSSSFQATWLLCLRWILEIFRPSAKAHSKHNFRHWDVDQQYPLSGQCPSTAMLSIPH